MSPYHERRFMIHALPLLEMFFAETSRLTIWFKVISCILSVNFFTELQVLAYFTYQVTLITLIKLCEVSDHTTILTMFPKLYLFIYLYLKFILLRVFLITQAVKLTIYTERKSKIFIYNIRK